MSQIKFGTDGWRAVIAEDFTFSNVARVAQATADYWGANPVAGTERKVVIGYDRRFFSDRFAQITAGVFAGNDFQVILTPEPTPTPSVSYAVKNLKAVGGVMITASHNPPIFNGFKLKSHFGGSSGPEECKGVEGMLDQNFVNFVSHHAFSHPLPTSNGDSRGEHNISIEDIRPAHFKAIKELVDFKLIAKSKLRVAHDALFGVGAGVFETLLAKTNCKVTTLNGKYDVLFGGICPEPLPKNYALGGAQLRKNPHDICLVTDGDSDRIGAMDGRGNPMTNQQVIALLLHHLVQNRGEGAKRGGRGVVTKTYNTTAMVDKMCAAWNLPLTEVGIGFRFIAPELMKPGALYGAEESGSIGFANHIPERDGLAAGLFLLEMLAMEKIPVNKIYAALEKEFGPHRYGRYDAYYPLEKRAALMESLKANPPAKLLRSPLAKVDARDGVKFVAEDSTWLMLRGSGTEPVLRIYAEGKSDADMQKLLKLGKSLLRG
ncbi:MAG TPA: phosphoglucomutase/phosphomannomutase family protein [Candidatus Acidoferrales bacterium]|jgi:phosphomannomutase|nr:phosphoglucomutase/phosphomannomutase family protein [Candidatus Acidoferrales bacterium]